MILNGLRLSILVSTMVTTLPWISASPAQEGEISRRQIGNGPVLGWQYVGCYSDSDSARTLSVSRDVGSQMTPLLCTTFCQGGLLDVTGINFAGTEFSDECYCDFNLQGTAIKLNDNECSYPCAGDSTYTCGGASRISVYQNMLLQGNLPKNKATVAGGWKFEGCHTDSLNTPPGRTLSQRVSTPTGQVTIESCTAQCGALGFSIAGLEYGQECWCGSRFLVGNSAAPSDDCSMACKADHTELCGAPNRLSVYIKA